MIAFLLVGEKASLMGGFTTFYKFKKLIFHYFVIFLKLLSRQHMLL